MSSKVVNTFSSTIKFVPECCKTQEMRDVVADTCPFLFNTIPDSQGMCSKVVSENSFMLKYCLDRYKIQEMFDKAVYASLPKLKFISIGLLQVRWLKNLILYSLMMLSSLLIKVLIT